MNLTKRILALSACIAILLQTASCQQKPDDIPASESGGTETALTTEPEETQLQPEIPDVRYDGESLRFLSRARTETVVRYYSEVSSEEANGETMNDSVWKRTVKIEDQYGIKIVDETSDSLKDTFIKSFTAGEDNWDVIIPSVKDALNLAISGAYLKDLNTVEYIDLSKPWWDGNVASDMSIDGHVFAAIGAMNTWTDSHTYAVVFDKKVAANYSVDPYSLVRDDKWNLDTFGGIVREVTHDLDGNSIMDEKDSYGAIADYAQFQSFMVSSGINIVTHNNDDMPEYRFDDKFYSAADRICTMMTDGNFLLADEYKSKTSDPWTDINRVNFRAGNSLFYCGGIEQLLIFRDLEADIGLIPMPKFDSEQENYYHTFSTHWASIIGIPTTNTKEEMTGLLLEAINADSYYGTSRDYFDVLLKNKAMRDEDSCEMLEIIRQSRTIDLEYAFSFIGISNMYNTLLKNKDAGTLASMVESGLPAAKEKLSKALEYFEN